MSAILTPAMQSFNAWWSTQSKVGDPSRRPHLTRDAFYAGWQAALELHPARDDRKTALNGSAFIGYQPNVEPVSLTFEAMEQLP